MSFSEGVRWDLILLVVMGKFRGSERGCGHLMISGCGCFSGRCGGEIEGHGERGGL